MLDVIETVGIIAILVAFLYIVTRDMPDETCDKDCAHCPFPPCKKCKEMYNAE